MQDALHLSVHKKRLKIKTLFRNMYLIVLLHSFLQKVSYINSRLPAKIFSYIFY